MKKLKTKKIFTIAAVTAAVLGVAGLIILTVASNLPVKLRGEQTAQRWAGQSGGEFVQYRCILPENRTLTLEEIYTFRQKTAETIAETDFENPKAATFVDGWSASGTTSITGPRGTFTPEALAVGGNFFAFHELTLRDGCYISEEDVMKDRVVIDEQLAWLLYGGTEVAGLTVTVGDAEYVIAGVVVRQSGKAYNKVCEGGPIAYFPYESLSAVTDSGTFCYEIVLPEPVKDYSSKILADNFDKDAVIINCSERFTVKNTLKAYKNLNSSGIRTKACAYPYWENAAQFELIRTARLRVAGFIILLPAAALAAFSVIFCTVKIYVGAKKSFARMRRKPWER